jgi:hypothetical protein
VDDDQLNPQSRNLYATCMHKFYLCKELPDALIGSLRSHLDCNLSAILQEAIVDFPKPSLAEHTLEVVRYDH